MKKVIGAAFVLLVAALAAPAQSLDDEKCRGKIYGTRET
jgi:hypothetical protein